MQPIIRIALPDIPGQCGSCGAASDEWPLGVYGGRLNVTCPVCFSIVAPVVAVAAPPAGDDLEPEDHNSIEYIEWLSGGNGD